MSAAMSHYDALDFGSFEQCSAGAPEREGANISVRELTRLLHIDYPDEAWLACTAFALRRVHDGEALLHSGDKFHSLYIVRSGCFKTVYTDFSGSEQVLGFPMCGDLMGADGIDGGHYKSTAVSLDTSEVVILPLTGMARLTNECRSLEALLYRVLSRELVRVQNMTWTLGTLGAEGRVAAFLLNLSERLAALGYSRCSFNLRMTRQEIGSYLGLKLETVSRALSALNNARIIHVHQRTIDIVDAAALRAVIDPAAGVPAGLAAHPASASARSGSNDDGNLSKPRSRFPSGRALRQLAA